MAAIKLKNPVLGVRSFEKDHAERILQLNETLKLKEGDRWELWDNKLTFKDGKITAFRSSITDNQAKEQGPHRESAGTV